MAQPVLTNNSPTTGSIAWTSFHVVYSPDGTTANNVDYTVAASNTNKRFVVWKYNAGTPTIVTDDNIPAGYDDKNDKLLFVNRSGIGIYAYNTGWVPGGLLVDGSIYAEAIATNAVVTDKLAANAITSEKIAADAVTAREIAADAIGAEQLSIGTFGSNVMINPQFEDWDVTTTYNYVKNPYASINLTDISSWAGTGGTAALTRITSGGPDATHVTAARLTWTVAGSSGATYCKTASTLTPGAVMSVGAMVKPGTTQNMYVAASCYNSSNVSTGDINGTSTSCSSASWTQLTLEGFTVPANTAYMYVLTYFTGATAIGQTLTSAMYGAVDGATYYYYDGDSDGAAWTGTAGGSVTIAMPYDWAKHSYATGNYVGQMFSCNSTSPVTGTKSLGIQAGSGTWGAAYGRYYPATAGDQFYMRGSVSCTTVVGNGLGLGMLWYDKTGAFISGDFDTFDSANGVASCEYIGTSPSTTAYARPFLWTGVTAAMTYWDDLEMGQRITNVMIKDGTIQATKLSLGSVGDNKVHNGNFEDVDVNGYVTGWTLVTTGTGGSAGLYAADRKSGGWALKLDRVAGVGSVYVYSDLMVVAEGKEYFYSALAKALGSSMASGAYIELQWYDDTQTYISSSYILSNAAMSTSWGVYEGRFSPEANSRYARVKLRNELASSSMMVDEVFLRESITGSLIVNGAIDGKTITGAVIKTSASSNRMEMKNDGSGGVLNFYTGVASETQGSINPFLSSTRPDIRIQSGTTPTYPNYSVISLRPGTSAAAAVVNIQTGELQCTGDVSGSVGSFYTLHSTVGCTFGGSTTISGTATVTKLIVNTPTAGTAIPNTRYNSGSSGGELLYTSHANSSKRYKKNVKRLELSHDQMYGLRPVKYNLKKKAPDRPADYEFWGFIAEEMDDLGMATLLGYDDEGRPDEVDYAKVAVVQQAAICDLNERVESLENQVSELSDLVTDLMARLDA